MATIPSIAMIPSGYKAGKVYSVLPTNGDADLTFTRASEATRVNETGLIETMATGVPRLDYSDGGCPSLLLEPQSTNLAKRSEEFDNNVIWTKTAMTVSTNTHLSPSNELTADTVFETATSANHAVVGETISYVAGTTYTGSVFFKPNGRNIRLTCSNTSFSSTFNALFDTTTKALINTSVSGNGVVSGNSIEDYGNGWYRISVSGNLPTDTFIRFTVYSIDGTTSNFLGDVTKGLIIWGAQLESGSLTSYIPTTTTSVTRIGESCSKSGLSSFIGQQEGVVFVDFDIKQYSKGEQYILRVNEVNLNDSIVFLKTSANKFSVSFRVNSVPVLSYISSEENIGRKKVAFVYKSGNLKLFINGVLVSSSANTYTNSITYDSIRIGGFNSILSVLNGKVYRFSLGNTIISDSEAIALTTI